RPEPKVQKQKAATGDIKITISNEREVGRAKVRVSASGSENDVEKLHELVQKNVEIQSQMEEKGIYSGITVAGSKKSGITIKPVAAGKKGTPARKIDWKEEERKFREEFSKDKVAEILRTIKWKTNPNPKITGDPRAKVGGTLVSGNTSFPSCLRYFGKNSSTTFNREMGDLCYEGLLGFDYDSLEYSPGIADKWYQHPDKQTFFYHINPKARFSDGTRVTASDFVETWKLLVNPDIQDPFQNDYWQKYFEPIALTPEVLVGRSKQKQWRAFLSFSNSLLAFPGHILKNIDGKEYLKRYQWDFLPGTGPYTFGSTDKESYITLKRRSDYWAWGEPRTKGLYNFETLKYVFIKDESLMRERFKKGELDWYMENTARRWVKESNYRQVQKGWIQKRRIFTKQPDGISGLAFNLRKSPFNDIRVRKAVTLLYNREKLIEKLFLNQYYPRNSWWVGLPYENPDNPKNHYDPATAIRLLEEAGWIPGPDGIRVKDGKRFELNMNFLSPSGQRIYTVFQEDLLNAGIKLDLKQVTWATDIKEMGARNFTISSRAYSGLFFPNPENSLHSKFADLKDNNNIFGYKNPVVDKLSEQYNAEFDPKKRVKICRKIDGIICRDYLWALGWYAPYTRVLYWNKFGQHPGYLGKYTYGDQRDMSRLWWYDPDKDRVLKEAVKNNTNLPVGETDVRYWDTH
ncbi:extracellular solute-binding protein, partial [Candidatus Riflebacteria bacterium]